MNRVELIYDKTCPNIAATRANLLLAFSRAGLTPRWDEWERDAPDAPEYAQGFGSPSILVNGRDIAGNGKDTAANSCRVYLEGAGENKGVPSVDLIAAALGGSGEIKGRGKGVGVLGGAAVGPGLFTAILAKAACPFCYPAIAGLLSSVGLGFLFTGTYMLALTAGLLGVVLFGLGYKAHLRRGYRPLVLGLIGAAAVMIDRLTSLSDPVLYLGIAGLTVASVWNLIPRKSPGSASCSACASGKSETQ